MTNDCAILVSKKETRYSLSLLSLSTIIYKSPFVPRKKIRGNTRNLDRWFFSSEGEYTYNFSFLILFVKFFFFHFSLKSVTFKMEKKKREIYL